MYARGQVLVGKVSYVVVGLPEQDHGPVNDGVQDPSRGSADRRRSSAPRCRTAGTAPPRRRRRFQAKARTVSAPSLGGPLARSRVHGPEDPGQHQRTLEPHRRRLTGGQIEEVGRALEDPVVRGVARFGPWCSPQPFGPGEAMVSPGPPQEVNCAVQPPSTGWRAPVTDDAGGREQVRDQFPPPRTFDKGA